MSVLRVGDVAPKKYVLEITSTEVDLTTVSAVAIRVRRPSGKVVTWAATPSNQTATTLRLTHVLEEDDLVAGEHVFVAVMTVPDGEIRSEPCKRVVLGEFQPQS